MRGLLLNLSRKNHTICTSVSVLALSIVTGCGYVSEAKYTLGLDADQDGILWNVDCDDSDPTIGTERTWYTDSDADGFGDINAPLVACFAPENSAENDLDCNDADASIYPNAPDAYYDGVDADCAGDNDCDQDGDGFDGSATGGFPTEACPNASDCDDADADIYPTDSASELYYNGVDDDCNLNTGDGDADGDGFWHIEYADIVISRGLQPLDIPAGREGDCYDSLNWPATGFSAETINGFDVVDLSSVYPGAVERYYDGVDSDCAGNSDFDQDGDGYSSAHYPNRNGVIGNDCVDQEADGYTTADITPADIYPSLSVVDTPYDGIDANCQGDNDFDKDRDGETIDAYDCDGDGTLDTSFDFDGDGVMDFIGGTDCNDNSAAIWRGAEELTGDGVDQNCDGYEACYADTDVDGFAGTSLVFSSDVTCSAYYTSSTDCDDSDATIYPNAPELCDGQVNTCGSSLPLVETDVDGDGYVACTIDAGGWDGDASIVGGNDCDDVQGASTPNLVEICDGIDNDCDGLVDDDDNDLDVSTATNWYLDADMDGFGSTTLVAVTCDAPIGTVDSNTDCDDASDFTYPGAAFMESNQTCVSDFDGDGYSPAELCYTIDLIDPIGDGWSLTQVDVWVDGVLDTSLQHSGSGVPMESTEMCFQGVDVQFQISMQDGADDADIDIFDTDGNLLGHGLRDLSVALWYWEGNQYQTGDIFFVDTYQGLSSDCDDNDATIYPNAPELCDGQVNTCGSSLPLVETDVDGDGYVACTIDAGGWDGDPSIVDGSDCDNSDDTLFPGQMWYMDVDLDGFGDIQNSVISCTQPSGYVLDDRDCNDANGQIYPYAVETADAIDDNCDGVEGSGISCVGEPAGNNYYLACTTPFVWNNANVFCENNYYDGLAMITEPSHHTTVNNLINMIPAANFDFWIGLNDTNTEGLFVWSDGTVYDFTGFGAWGPSQPDSIASVSSSADADCVSMSSIDSMWYDEFCAQSRPFVCSVVMQ